MTFRGYGKQGRRPVFIRPPYKLLEYKNDYGRVAFEYNTHTDELRFDYDEFYSVKNIFDVSVPDLVDFCKEYAANKFNISKPFDPLFFARKLN